MTIHWTALGILLVLAMLAHLAAAAALGLRWRGAGHAAFAGGLALAAGAFVVRWVEVRHLPMQNLFEVFLSMGMLMYPLSLFCRRFLDVRGQAADAFIGFVVLLPAALVFNPDPQRLPPALQSPLFAPHVAAYLFAYVIMAKAAVHAVLALAVGERRPGRWSDFVAGLRAALEALSDRSRPREPRDRAASERAAYRMAGLGFPLLTLGLVLGAWWGKLAWGDYWHWDPKELWSLVSWLLFLGYFHVRFRLGPRYPRLAAALVVCGFGAIVITLLWVNLARIFAGLHSYA
jgi:cytochrome c-type biogenesis protein CcsB